MVAARNYHLLCLLFQESIHSRVFFSGNFLCFYQFTIFFVWSGGVILVCHSSSESNIWRSNASSFLLQLIRRIIGLTAVAMSTHISHRTQSLRHLLVCYLPLNNGAEQVELVQPL